VGGPLTCAEVWLLLWQTNQCIGAAGKWILYQLNTLIYPLRGYNMGVNMLIVGRFGMAVYTDSF